MEKRYQVFVSSTFTDLIAERQAALSAVLELGHMPAGMELFAAGDDAAWQLIKDVIDSSDYYLLIIGGRYGSTDETGLSYTEKEYDYAVSTRKPVLAFLHANPEDIPRGKTEIDSAAWEKLKAFRAKVEKRHTRGAWSTAEELKSKIALSLIGEFRRHPAVGWVRADAVPSENMLSELLALRTRIAQLEGELLADKTKPPRGTEDLVQGEEKHTVPVVFIARLEADSPPYKNDVGYTATVEPSWNEIFAAVAPSLITEATAAQLESEFRSFFDQLTKKTFAKGRGMKDRRVTHVKVDDKELDTLLIQFRALGLIQESLKKRGVRDTKTYWTLTPYGDSLMTQLRGIRRNAKAGEPQVSAAEEVPVAGTR